MNKATSFTAWPDAVGNRMSITYSEIDETTGKIIADNKRTDIVVLDKEANKLIADLLEFAQESIEAQQA